MPLQTLPCRAFQRGFALGARLLPWRTPLSLIHISEPTRPY